MINKISKKLKNQTIITNVCVLIFSGFLYALGQTIFLNKANIYLNGYVAVTQFIVYTFNINNQWFGFINLAMNIPLIIFAFIKYPRKNLIFYTLVFLFSMAISAVIINNFSVLANANPFDAKLTAKGVIQESWGWVVIVQAAIGAIIIGISVALAFKFSGSTGGTDIPVIYIGYKTGKSISNLSAAFAISITFIAISLNAIIKKNGLFLSYINIYACGSYFYIFVYNISLNRFFPKYKKIKMEISVSDPTKIKKAFHDINYHHAYRIVEVTSGYTMKKRYQIESIVLFYELKSFTNLIKSYDSSAWISYTKIESVHGKFVRKD